jgi:hypothetical protein
MITDSAATRTRLPNRRLLSRWRCEWQGIPFAVDFGFDDAGKVRELFVSRDPDRLGKGMASGTPMAAIFEGACVDVSLLLQLGYRPTDLERRYPGPRTALTPQQMIDDSPPQRALALLAVEAELAEGEAMRLGYERAARIMPKAWRPRPADPGALPVGSTEVAP